MYVYTCRVFFFSLLHLLNVSPWGHVRNEGVEKKKRSVLPVGKYSQYLFVHIRRRTKKKKEGNMWKKRVEGYTRIYFFPRRRRRRARNSLQRTIPRKLAE